MGKVEFLYRNVSIRNALILLLVIINLTHQHATSNSPIKTVFDVTNSTRYHQSGFNVNVRLQSSLSGFHRELTINVTATNTNVVRPERCFLLLKQTFPKDMFVDPYQIKQQCERFYQMHLAFDVDLEKPARLAHPQIVSIFWNMTDVLLPKNSKNAAITFPFHLRYQDADYSHEDGNYVDIYLENPTIFLRCNDHDLGDHQQVIRDVCEPPDWSSTCLWIQYQSLKKNDSKLRFRVPRGNLTILPLVNVITTAVIFLSCLAITLTLCYKRQPIKGKHKTH